MWKCLGKNSLRSGPGESKGRGERRRTGEEGEGKDQMFMTDSPFNVIGKC